MVNPSFPRKRESTGLLVIGHTTYNGPLPS